LRIADSKIADSQIADLRIADLRIGGAEIERARARIARYLRVTPLVESGWLSRAAQAEVRLKLESTQVSNSFKARGALNAVARLREDGQSVSHVVTASAGNHGRAIAWAACLCSLRATVFTPRAAPDAKRQAILEHGADLRDECESYEDAEARARNYAREHGATFISPYNHEDVIAGAGTVGLEILDAWPEVEAVVVPVGGGGLISGITAAMKAAAPHAVEVIGVEAEASQAFTAARSAGQIVSIDVKPTIADGLGGNVEPDTLTWPYIRDLVDRMVTVSEADLHAAIRNLIAQDHLVAEGAGAAAVAAVASGQARIHNRCAAVILSGANIDLEKLSAVISA
jgi:threonine dehydratase